MRNRIILAGIAFAVALAYIVGTKLSNEAMAVVVGAVCGISASIPVSIGLVIATSNNWGPQQNVANEPTAYDPRRYAPPVVIMSPPQTPMPYGYGYQPQPYFFPAPVSNQTIDSRDFKIVGGE